MNRQQKEVQQVFLDNEKAVFKKLEENYKDALDEINSNINILLARKDADMQHVIYQVEYQKALKTQISAILEQLQNKEFESLSEYLTKSYEDGFIGTMYDLQGQGIPLVMPIDQAQVVAAIQHETQLSENLYTSLGKDIKKLSKQIAGEVSRGISNAVMYEEIARNIQSFSRIPLNRAMTIARTEAHRIQCKSTSDAQWKAKEKGADVMKQWDSALDKKTRKSHRELDGQIRELDEPFEINGHQAMEPGGFGVASEDINCRCQSVSRARWALDAEETKYLAKGMSDKDLEPLASKLGMTVDELREFEGNIVPIRAKNYEDFKRKYDKIWRYEGSDLEKEAESRIAGYGKYDRARSREQKMNENEALEKTVKSDKINVEAVRLKSGSATNKYFKNQSDYLKKEASQDLRDNIKWYSVNGYQDINGMIRGTMKVDKETRQYVSDFRKVMNEHMDRMELTDNLIIYRAVERSTLEKAIGSLENGIGKTWTDKGYMSTSTVEKIVDKFAKGLDNPVKLEIEVPKGKGHGLYINEASVYKNSEYEFLLRENTRCKIKEVVNEKGQIIVRMEVI